MKSGTRISAIKRRTAITLTAFAIASTVGGALFLAVDTRDKGSAGPFSTAIHAQTDSRPVAIRTAGGWYDNHPKHPLE